MLDLTKPIRRVDKRPARVLATDLPNGFPCCIAWQTPAGNWNADTFAMDGLDEFENVPPPQEWRWMYPSGFIGEARHETRAECAKDRDPNSGQPVRILREGETP